MLSRISAALGLPAAADDRQLAFELPAPARGFPSPDSLNIKVRIAHATGEIMACKYRAHVCSKDPSLIARSPVWEFIPLRGWVYRQNPERPKIFERDSERHPRHVRPGLQFAADVRRQDERIALPHVVPSTLAPLPGLWSMEG